MTDTADPNHWTQLIRDGRSGDRAASDRLFAEVFAELRELARGLMGGERADHTLQATALVNEAWLRIASSELDAKDRAHFFRTAARAMRRTLVDHARARAADKRADRRASRLTVGSIESGTSDSEPVDLLDLHDALDHLAAVDEELARIVELRYFGGLTLAETGELLGATPQAVHRSWNLARAWLHRRLHAPREGGS